MEKYAKHAILGEGTYAVVYSGTSLSTKQRVAIKKIKLTQSKDGIDMSAIREIKFLRELTKQDNIIKLLDVYSTSQTTISLVLEFLVSDLEILIKDRQIIFKGGDIKSWMLMTLRGLAHCHERFILHRDLKPSNLLIAANGTLKIADFGLARSYASDKRPNMTPQVVTRWYRAPELLMGARAYETGIDIWAVGCIFAELMLRVPYLPADNDLQQLDTIYRALGKPSADELDRMSNLSNFVPISIENEFTYPPERPDLSTLFTAASQDALSLLNEMLAYDPSARPEAREALSSAYFRNAPRPTQANKLPKKSGIDKVGDSLKRKAGEDDNPSAVKVSRKLTFE